MQNKKNKKAFSIIVAIFMTGFLMILTIWVLNLVLREMKDNKWNENYLKSYAWAEWAMELWLLKIKENSFSYDEDLEMTSSGAESLSFNSTFNKNKDPKISFDMEVKTDKIEKWIIWTWATVIIPLFWQNETSSWKTIKIALKNIYLENGTTNAEDSIIWNIISSDWWKSWTWSFVEAENSNYLNNTTNNTNYLILFNRNSTEKIKYDLIAKSWEYFSNPNWKITSSVKIGKYKQNISINIDNTEFLKMLKYSLYNK